MSRIVKEELPEAIVIQGGILPTVQLQKAMEDPNVDYWIIGEGEYRLPRLLDELNRGDGDLSGVDGLAGGPRKDVQPLK